MEISVSSGGNLTIPVDELTENAVFYPVNVDGTEMEVIAVKTSDGTIRTAFNTCQICYDSGNGRTFILGRKYLSVSGKQKELSVTGLKTPEIIKVAA